MKKFPKAAKNLTQDYDKQDADGGANCPYLISNIPHLNVG